MKTIKLLAAVAVFAVACAATTVTGTIKYPNGAAFTGSVTFSLTAPAGAGGAVLVPSVTVVVVSGALPANFTLQGNDVITPAGTYYAVNYYDAFGNLVMTNNYVITGSTFDLGQSVPTPVTTNHINYLDLLGLRSLSTAQLTITSGTIGGIGLGTNGDPINGIVTKDPWLDVRAFGASGSAHSTTGTLGSGSASLAVGSALDFANGQGIIVAGAGAAVTLAAPGTPTVAVTGSTSSQSCTYAIAALDMALGETAASPATASQKCGNAGSSTNNVISTYNTLTWTPVTGAMGYVVYESIGSGYGVAQIVSIPTNVPWWTSGTSYASGQLIQPRGPQFNGWFYKATAAGTSGGSQPTWCTTANCTVTDNGVTWTAQPFSWRDDGRNWMWFGIEPNIPTIPAAPPASAVNDALVTTIASGGGTTVLTLSTSATASVTGVYVGHDNTAAFNAAFSAQTTACVSTQPVPGSASYGTCPAVMVPAGTYMVSGPLVAASAYGGIRGTDQAVLLQINPVADVLDFTNAYQDTIDSLTVIGGKRQVVLNNGTQDNIKITLARVQLEWSNDYAVAAFNNSTLSDFHLSSSVTIAGAKFLADQGEFYDYGDRANWSANWSETLPSQQSLMWGQGQIVMAEPGGELHSSGSEYIPDATTPAGVLGGVPQGEHWVEDWWQFYSNGDRFSGESGGGYPCVYYEGGFPATAPNLGIVAGGAVSLTDDWLFCGGSAYGPGAAR